MWLYLLKIGMSISRLILILKNKLMLTLEIFHWISVKAKGRRNKRVVENQNKHLQISLAILIKTQRFRDKIHFEKKNEFKKKKRQRLLSYSGCTLYSRETNHKSNLQRLPFKRSPFLLIMLY